MSRCTERILDKFMGAMAGAVIGDVLGSPLEFISDSTLSPKVVRKQFDKYKVLGKRKLRHYTDDTAMALQLGHSLLQNRGFHEVDLAKRFSKEYFKEPYRGYGKGVVEVFAKLEETGYKDVWQPAREQFDGTGSLGNGGAMRVHPVALFAYVQGEEYLKGLAMNTAKITHAHEQGFNGAVLQAMAVFLALHDTPKEEFTQTLKRVSCEFGENSSAKESYLKSIGLLETCLETNDDRRAYLLGNDVIALRSVPSSIYSFLRILESESCVKGFDELESNFVKVLQLAYSFGGDTDTIGSMAGAIAGAYWGHSRIPQYLLDQCEGVEQSLIIAQKLHEIVFDQSL